MENETKKSLIGADSKEIAEAIAKVLDDKLAKDIKILKVDDKTVITDYFVICTANSNTHMKALSGEVEFKLGEMGLMPAHTEGLDGNTWVAMDYLHVIVHIFMKEQREFYKLEKMWGDAQVVEAENISKD